MIQTRKALAFVLSFPIFALLVLTAYKGYVHSYGQEIILPITGYDPRDLLSGHYLIYEIDYGVAGICSTNTGKQAGYVCLEPRTFSYSAPEDCGKLIRGECTDGRFEAGIERFYVPEARARELEELIRSKAASIVLSLPRSGQAQVKDLLLDGASWKDLR